MAFAWTLLIGFFMVLAWYTDRRAKKYQRKYLSAAEAAEKEMAKADSVPINRSITAGGRLACGMSLCKAAKFGEERDRLEALYAKWEPRAAGLRGVADWLKGCKGRKLPYTVGAVDFATVLWAIDKFGLWPYLTSDKVVEASKLAWAWVQTLLVKS